MGPGHIQRWPSVTLPNGSVLVQQARCGVAAGGALLKVPNDTRHRAVIGHCHQGGKGYPLTRTFGDEARAQAVPAKIPVQPRQHGAALDDQSNGTVAQSKANPAAPHPAEQRPFGELGGVQPGLQGGGGRSQQWLVRAATGLGAVLQGLALVQVVDKAALGQGTQMGEGRRRHLAAPSTASGKPK